MAACWRGLIETHLWSGVWWWPRNFAVGHHVLRHQMSSSAFGCACAMQLPADTPIGTPMQRTVDDMQALSQTRSGFLSRHGHRPRRSQIDSMVLHTVYIVVCGVGPFAATMRLSLNCSPMAMVHCTIPASVTDICPILRSLPTSFLHI